MARKDGLALRLRNNSVAIAAGTGLALGTAAMMAPQAQAQEPDGHDLKLFFGGAYVEPLSDSSLAGIADTVEASSEFGIEIGGEWKVTDRLGLEISYLDANHDVEFAGAAIGDIDLRPWNFGVNFHIVNRDLFDWYVGPTLSYIDWSSVALTDGGSLDVDSETTWGVSTGVVFGLGQTFGIDLGLRYLDARVESPALPDDVAVDPLFTRVGLSLRF